MQIRLMNIDDYDEIFALWRQCRGMGLRSLDDSRDGVSAFLKRNPSSCFVAEEGGATVGAILCGNDGRRGYIYHMCVHSAYRNRGYGTALVEAACAALEKEGITRVCLNIVQGNEMAKKFWQDRGWEQKPFLEFYSKPVSDRQNLPLGDSYGKI